MELPAILDTIKADADAWLADDQCVNLRQILQQPRPPLQMPLARVKRHETETRRDVVLAETAERAS